MNNFNDENLFNNSNCRPPKPIQRFYFIGATGPTGPTGPAGGGSGTQGPTGPTEALFYSSKLFSSHKKTIN